MNKRIWLYLVCFCIGLLAVPCFAELDIRNIYGLHDEAQLKLLSKEIENQLAEDQFNPKLLKTIGVIYHNLAVLKINGTSEKAVQYLEKARELYPTDNIIVVYLGSATTMVARDSWNFFTKLADVNKGINLIDKAVNKEPENAILRVVRGLNNLSLPDFLNRKFISKQDFLYIEQLLNKTPGQLDNNTISQVYYQLGIIFKEEKNMQKANEYFHKSVDNMPTSVFGALAKKEL